MYTLEEIRKEVNHAKYFSTGPVCKTEGKLTTCVTIHGQDWIPGAFGVRLHDGIYAFLPIMILLLLSGLCQPSPFARRAFTFSAIFTVVWIYIVAMSGYSEAARHMEKVNNTPVYQILQGDKTNHPLQGLKLIRS